MDRRNFLKKAALVTAGLSFSKPSSVFSNGLATRLGHSSRFSLNLITDAPDLAVHEIEKYFRDSHLSNQNLSFTEHRLLGKHVGDIVLVENGKLVNFRQFDTDLALHLRDVSQRLALPKALLDPVMLTFSNCGSALAPRKLAIFRDNFLIDRIALHEDIAAYSIDGAKGRVIFAMKDQSARIISAECKHKTCMKLDNIRRPGQHLVCIPNRIRISIEGGYESDVDGIVY